MWHAPQCCRCNGPTERPHGPTTDAPAKGLLLSSSRQHHRLGEELTRMGNKQTIQRSETRAGDYQQTNSDSGRAGFFLDTAFIELIENWSALPDNETMPMIPSIDEKKSSGDGILRLSRTSLRASRWKSLEQFTNRLISKFH